jgi:hypothetical protein
VQSPSGLSNSALPSNAKRSRSTIRKVFSSPAGPKHGRQVGSRRIDTWLPSIARKRNSYPVALSRKCPTSEAGTQPWGVDVIDCKLPHEFEACGVIDDEEPIGAADRTKQSEESRSRGLFCCLFEDHLPSAVLHLREAPQTNTQGGSDERRYDLRPCASPYSTLKPTTRSCSAVFPSFLA